MKLIILKFYNWFSKRTSIKFSIRRYFVLKFFNEDVIYFISSASTSTSFCSSFLKFENSSSNFLGCFLFLSSFEPFLSRKATLPFVATNHEDDFSLLFCSITLEISLYSSFSIWIKLSTFFSSTNALFLLYLSTISLSTLIEELQESST